MKLMHLGDLHLGKHVHEFSMIEDQRYILKEIIQIAKEQSVDAVLIAGDLYDRSLPGEEAVILFDTFLTELADLGKSVFVISGNHDSEERLNFGSRLFRSNQIYITGKYKGEMEYIDLEDAYGPLHIWMMPYIKASRVAYYYPEEDTSSYEAAFRTALSKCDISSSERNVILLHQFVIGASGDPQAAGSESSLLSVGTIEKVSADCFDDFDYVAMGHIHTPQAVGRETCRYAGSPLKYSLNQRELNSQKSVTLITMEEKGKVIVESLPLKPLREIRRIYGKLEDLLAHAADTEDYIYATLTDEIVPFDAMARLREVYPNTMKLDYDNEAYRALEILEEESGSAGKSFQELFFEFYHFIHGREPNEEEWEVLEEIAREAGVME